MKELNFNEYLEIPTVSKKSKITFINDKKNPIIILLADGTKLFLNIHQYKRISGDIPSIGKYIEVIFQRNSLDKSKEPSKIEAIKCY